MKSKTPWVLADTSAVAVRHDPVLVVDADHSEVAVVACGGDVSWDEAVANARLIAAAPDAHAILLAMHEYFRHHSGVEPSALFDERTFRQAVEAYLKKAGG